MALTKTTYSMINGACYNVLDYGANPSLADNTAAIQAALDACNSAGGGRVHFPAGTYLTGKLTVYSNMMITGDGVANTIIKLKANSNTSLVISENAYAQWAANSSTGTTNLTIYDIVFDGNRAQNPIENGESIYQAGVVLYGYGFKINRVHIINTRDAGFATKWYLGEPDPYTEASFFGDMVISISGRDGWYASGPHDMNINNVLIANAGQNIANNYSGMHFLGEMNARVMGCHVFSHSSYVRMKEALFLESSNSDFTNCHFEGASYANVHFKNASNNNFDPACRFYSLVNYAGGSQMILEGVCLYNNIRGLFGPGQGDLTPGAAPVFAVQLGVNSLTDNVAANNIDVIVNQNEAGVLYYNMNAGAAGRGQNTMRFNEFSLRSGTIYPITGTYVASDMIELITEGNRRLYQNTNIQNGSVVVAANSSATFTFAFPFENSPVVILTPKTPTGPLASGFWDSAVSVTSVVVFNNSANSATFDIIAMKSMTF